MTTYLTKEYDRCPECGSNQIERGQTGGEMYAKVDGNVVTIREILARCRACRYHWNEGRL